MDDKDTKELTLASSMEDIEQKLKTTTDIDELDKTIVPLFNTNLKKQNMARLMKVSELLDLTVNQMAERLVTMPFDFNNKELLEYYKVMQDAVNKPVTLSDDLPAIQINNITVDASSGLDRTSRAKITSVIDQILAQAQQPEEPEEEIIDVIFDEEEDING